MNTVTFIYFKIHDISRKFQRVPTRVPTASCFSFICSQVRQMRVRVEEARSSMSAARSQGRVVESLMKLKTSGQRPGIHGRLVRTNLSPGIMFDTM